MDQTRSGACSSSRTLAPSLQSPDGRNMDARRMLHRLPREDDDEQYEAQNIFPEFQNLYIILKLLQWRL